MRKVTRLFFLIAAIVAWGSVANAANTQCAGTSTAVVSGTVSLGYNYTFTTSGTNVTITFELLDIKTGLVAQVVTPENAYTNMSNTAGQVYTTTITGQSTGTTITYAAYFSFAGGSIRTADLTYTVGNTCVAGPPDTQVPTGFTATKGAVTSNGVELLLNGTDDSGAVTYAITYGTTTVNTSSTSGVQKSYIVTGLTPSTAYSFSIVAKDATGNVAANSPLVVPATTTALPAPDISATTPPVYSPAKVISIFSDAYTNVAGTNFNPGWGQSTAVSNIQIGTDNIMRYSNLNYQGTVFGSDVNASNMKYLHIDVWTANETSLQIFPIMNGDAFEKFYQVTPINLNAWNSYDIPLTAFTSQGLILSDLIQLKIVGAGGNTVYLDNIYFYDNTATVDTQAPTNFTATAGVIASDGVQLLLNATDDSGVISYTISYGSGPTVINVPGISGVQKIYTVSGLTGSTGYNFSVVAKDATGNVSVNSPVLVSATTLASLAAAPTPTYLASKVISIYNDIYNSVMSPNGWEDWYGNTFSTVSLGGNSTLKDIATCCFGVSFATPTIDVSSMNNLHVDIYPLTATTMTFGFITSTVTPQKVLTLTTGQWNSINLSLSELKTLFPTADYTQVKQISISPVNGTLYLDNLFFYNDGPNAVSTVISENGITCFPNPITNNVTISAKTEINQVIIRNLLGQSVKSVSVNASEKTIDLSDVASGNYIITLKLANGQMATQKIIKL